MVARSLRSEEFFRKLEEKDTQDRNIQEQKNSSFFFFNITCKRIKLELYATLGFPGHSDGKEFSYNEGYLF